MKIKKYIQPLLLRKSMTVSKSAHFIAILILLMSAFYSNSQTTIKTLFLGNSYTAFNNLPQLVHDVALSVGDTLVFDSYTPGGYQLIDHSTNATSQDKITNGDWDYVVIQGQSQEPITQYNTFLNGAITLRNQIKQVDSCTVIMPYMTWGRKNGDASNCASFPIMCTYEGMDTTIRNRYLNITNQANGEVSPVSVVWNYIRQNHPSIELYQQDESHPSPAGSYAAACCFYAAIFKKDPTSITYDFSLNATEALLIRNAAKIQVFDQLGEWDFKKQPSAQFYFTKGSGMYEMNFFIVNSTGVQQNYYWDFGDGNTSTLQNPTHSYSGNGTYTVTLTTNNCNLQGWNTAAVDTVIQLCSHTPTIYTTDPWLCNYDTLWTQTADSYQWLCGGTVLPGENNQYLSNYAQYNFSSNFSVYTSDNSCSELSEDYNAQTTWSGYYFDALGDPCLGDTVHFAVLNTSGSLHGFEIINWFKNDTQLTMMNNEDTLMITEGGVYEVQVIDTTSNCPMDTTIYSIEYDCNTVGINEVETHSFATLYPNPAEDYVIIKFHQNIDGKQLQIHTMDGRLIQSKEITSNIMEMNIADLPNGIYFIRLSNGSQPAIKLIKQ